LIRGGGAGVAVIVVDVGYVVKSFPFMRGGWLLNSVLLGVGSVLLGIWDDDCWIMGDWCTKALVITPLETGWAFAESDSGCIRLSGMPFLFRSLENLFGGQVGHMSLI
jgi:hypothetical protein